MKAMTTTMNYNITPKMIELFEILIGWQKGNLGTYKCSSMKYILPLLVKFC